MWIGNLLIICGIVLINFLEIGICNSDNDDSWLMKLAQQIVSSKDDHSWRFTDDCKCGIKNNSSERIVGGIVSKPNAWPWMAAVVFMGDEHPKILCGASIINTQYLLTAAHCVDYLQKYGIKKFQIYLGTNNLNDSDVLIPPIESVISHPKYKNDTKAFDIGLIKLKSPLEFNSKISPICLTPQSGVPYNNRQAIVSGWGTTLYGGEAVTMQMQAMVNITTNKSCQKKYIDSEDQVKITPNMICAFAPGSDACQGDSGGPLFLKRKESFEVYEQIGIVSFGSGCADEKYPGVYSRIGKLLGWIKFITKDAMYCNNGMKQ